MEIKSILTARRLGTALRQGDSELFSRLLARKLGGGTGGGGSGDGPVSETLGKVWVRSNQVFNTAYQIAHHNGLWVVAANNGLLYSNDGKEWINAGSQRAYSVAYANGMWVAVSNSSDSTQQNAQYSTDGMNWTKSDFTIRSQSVVFGNGVWVAGSNNSPIVGLCYSTDGKTWAKSNIRDKKINNVFFANGMWTAATNSAGLYYSTDGMTWTQSNITTGVFNRIAYHDGMWVVCHYDVHDGLYYSTDGMTWAKCTPNGETFEDFNDIAYANGLWVAVGRYGAWYSIDGVNWTQSEKTDQCRAVAYGDGIWVLSLNSSTATCLYYSTDGKTWTPSNEITTVGSCYFIHYADGVFVVTSSNGNGIFYSE